jgi:prolipoprotein diacylglyceryl transferase
VKVRLLASIPSPSDGIVHIGPLPLHAYGLMLALGVIAATRLAEPRAIARGFEPGLIANIATKVVVGGVLGARVYHLFTGYDWSADGFWGIFAIWRGGLSIWGAVGGGVLVLIVIARHRHLDTLALLDAIGPCVAVAQAIGRWGNWFNQELFGRPSTLPWAVEIDKAHRPAGYEHFTTFQPTFLYESIWCLGIWFVITRAERRFSFARGQAFALYVALYTFERTFMELLRVDKATHVFGIRFNALLSAVICVVFTVWFLRLRRKQRRTTAASSRVSDEPTIAPS